MGQQVNEGNGINTQGVERPQGQKQGCCIIRALLTPGQYTRTACFTLCLNKGQIVLCADIQKEVTSNRLRFLIAFKLYKKFTPHTCL